MIDQLDKLGASLIVILLQFFLAFGPLALGVKLTERLFLYRNSRRFEVPVGIAVVVTFYAAAWVLFFPSVQSLERHACKGDPDFQACVYGDDAEPE